MTQILAALTQDYVLVASDRRLTVVSGAQKGQMKDDNTCKLVSLCGVWGIAYTGFSELQGVSTHEWIAVRLAENGCRNPYVAAQILVGEGSRAFKLAPFPLELTFIIAGWARLSRDSLQPHFLLISNMYDTEGKRRNRAGEDLQCFERKLKPEELYASRVIGQPLPPGRGKNLDRLFRRLLKHQTGPKPAMQAFAKEIVNTSTNRSGVGDKVLAFSIPRAAAQRTYETGDNMMLAMEPDLLTTAFCYFDPAYSQLRQYGPTFVCGDSAVTDVETADEPSRNFQSSSFRILHLPESGSLPALVLRAKRKNDD
jgi:hypothetical protein